MAPPISDSVLPAGRIQFGGERGRDRGHADVQEARPRVAQQRIIKQPFAHRRVIEQHRDDDVRLEGVSH
jgi:hypothetical protein